MRISNSIGQIKQAIIESRDYVVHRKPDNQPNWFFQIYISELYRRSMKWPFNIVVICDYQSQSELVFSISYIFLKENILPFAHIENNRRFLFNVNKGTYEFNWSRNIKIDGKAFLIKK